MSKTRNKFSPEVRDRAVRMVGGARHDIGRSQYHYYNSLSPDAKHLDPAGDRYSALSSPRN